MVFALLEAGAHVDAQDDASASPAMLAAGLGHDSTLRLLQVKGFQGFRGYI